MIEDFDPAFDNLITLLNSLSDHEQISETPTEIRDDITGQKSYYISRKKYRGYLLDKADYSEIDLPEYLKPLPPALAQTLLQTAEQLAFDLPESLAAAPAAIPAYLDGGRNVKPSKFAAVRAAPAQDEPAEDIF